MENYHRIFANMYGEKIECTYVPLTKGESWEIEYTTLGTISAALSNASVHLLELFKSSAGIKNADVVGALGVSRAISAIYQSVPFDVLMKVASKILRGAIIQRPDRSVEIDNLADTDFFDDHLDELMLATFWGLDVSYPRAFTKARGFLVALFERAPGKTTSKESSTQSTGEPQSSSQSQDSTG